ncbi:uncharacterized protein [Centruroides vittatus]|uniref:uncharacterized protein n=1 Tax=Centruroides vittatus TaxID=120091 RepID=UPI00350FBAE5
MKVILFLLFVFLCEASESPIADNYMDILTQTITRKKGHETINIYDFTVSKMHNIGGKLVQLKIDYTDCLMTGFYRVKRHGNCSPIYRKDTSLSFTCYLEFSGISFHYSAMVWNVTSTPDNFGYRYKLRYDYIPFYAKASFNTRYLFDFPGIYDFALDNNAPVNYTLRTFETTIVFRKVVAEILPDYSITAFLKSLNTRFVPNFSNLAYKIPVLESALGVVLYPPN